MARIFIIDDQDFVRFTLKQVLARAGHEVMEASNGREALEKIPAENPDLVITDILMPEIGGIEIITELKKAFPALKVIAMSGGGRTENKDFLEMANETGADATLLKPFRAHEVLDLVDSALA